MNWAYVNLTALLLFWFGIYGPSASRYRKLRFERRKARPVDLFLDGLTALAWQFLPVLYVISGAPHRLDYNLPVSVSLVGTLMLIVALWVLWHAYRALGENWSPTIEVRAHQQLVTSGIYARLRHPIYSALWLWALAQPLLLHNFVVGFAMLAAYVPLWLIRVPREERMMAETFGSAWIDYAARTGRILPRFRSRLQVPG